MTARRGGNDDCDRESGQPGDAGIDTQALRRRYRLERDKRLRPDGDDQYRLTGALAHHLDDPCTPKSERPPKTDHLRVVCIGAGFAGLIGRNAVGAAHPDRRGCYMRRGAELN